MNTTIEYMATTKGGSGRGQGRKKDWGKKPESKIGVPIELVPQKKHIVEIWTILQQSGLELGDLARSLKNHGIDFIQQDITDSLTSSNSYRMYSTSVGASFGVTSSIDAEAGGYEEIYLESILGIKSPERTSFMRVKGESMIDDGILPGAILTVEMPNTTASKSWLEPQDGNTVIALIDGTDLTVKKFRKNDKGEFLVPRNRENKNFKPLQVSSRDPEWTGGHEVEIVGIVRKIALDP